jgi:hypothetical protein
MKRRVRLILAFITFMLPAMSISESTEEQSPVCDASRNYTNLYIPSPEIYKRMMYQSWPEIPPPYRLARTTGIYNVFQIKVSTSGDVCFIETVGGNPVFVPVLMSEIKKWKFRPDAPFWGIIAIKFATSGGEIYQLI